jgi:hypothetical protein
MKDIARQEHEAWQRVCSQLHRQGAVKKSDLESRVSEKETPGQRLLRAIRLWGDLRVEMFKERGSL